MSNQIEKACIVNLEGVYYMLLEFCRGREIHDPPRSAPLWICDADMTPYLNFTLQQQCVFDSVTMFGTIGVPMASFLASHVVQYSLSHTPPFPWKKHFILELYVNCVN
ncbi:predicted protein [Aspergillus terreus NIH2624]|uniref:Uncharacterized protein n=1 Tax=Aspergillus terreus (strain NIH 2624 / FGSC A1156) TaxID=341663 RepID=Q0CMW1_ASPTN|nr:uncharacterized protein ATEG_04973 [Aspergillus terreus NIH2624]EAU34042.1 predicted protein [Aspergillus terreus NIH2624]